MRQLWGGQVIQQRCARAKAEASMSPEKRDLPTRAMAKEAKTGASTSMEKGQERRTKEACRHWNMSIPRLSGLSGNSNSERNNNNNHRCQHIQGCCTDRRSSHLLRFMRRRSDSLNPVRMSLLNRPIRGIRVL